MTIITNRIRIRAPRASVDSYLVTDDGSTYFDMHRLFPEIVPADNAAGHRPWRYPEWNIATRSKSLPALLVIAAGMETIIRYETEWAPNIGTTERLHLSTWWRIEHWSEAYNGSFDGWFICDGGQCRLYDHLRRPLAERGLPKPDYDEEPWDFPTDT